MEINLSWILLSLFYLSALALVTKIIFRQHHPNRKAPPGPKPWPIIGNLHLVGSIPHRSIHSLSQKYGEIMELQFGKFPVVVASSPEMARQFLNVHDKVFASRPSLTSGKYTAYNYQTMGHAPYGPYFRQARKIYSNEVLSEQKLKSYEHIRAGERRRLLSDLYSLAGKPITIRDHLTRCTLSTISRIVLSNNDFSASENEKTIVDMEELRGLMEEWFVLNGVTNIGDWIPWLNSLDLQGYIKKMKALYTKMDGFLDYVIDDHQARRVAGKEFVAKDVVDVLLQLADDPKLKVKLTKDSIKGLLQDLLVGGTDTSAVTIDWTIHEILRNPRVAKKAKEELDRVIGRNRWVEESDFSQLPYIESIIMESMRLRPISTFLAPHYATKDCNVAGYDILNGTMVLINTWSLGRDPNSWDAPEEFLPERFLGKETDILGGNLALLPFGSGRRRCPGYSLGLKIVRATLANLLHGFDLKLPEGMKPEDVCMDEVYGLTTHLKDTVPITMEPTLPSHLYK